MKVDLVIIGAGFWGSTLFLELQRLEQSPLLLDADLPGAASRVAAGLVRETSLETWLPSWWRPAHAGACRAFLERWGQRGEELVVSQWDRTASSGRKRQGLWQLRPGDILQAGLPWRVERLQWDRGRWLVHCQQQVVNAGRVVLAAGIYCDRILQRSGLQTLGLLPLPGSALLGVTSQTLEMPHTRGYRLAGDTRTRTVTARNWESGLLRVGDTSGALQVDQLIMVRRWYAAMGGQGSGQRLWGIRPRSRQGILVERWGPGLIVASGGGRTGLASAAGVALRVCQLLAGG